MIEKVRSEANHEIECFSATTIGHLRLPLLAACGDNTIVVIGNHYGVEAGVVEREGPEVEVGGHKFY